MQARPAQNFDAEKFYNLFLFVKQISQPINKLQSSFRRQRIRVTRFYGLYDRVRLGRLCGTLRKEREIVDLGQRLVTLPTFFQRA
jgi:hypothetical protein